MNAQDFCYWLHGYFEINEGNGLTLSPHQVEIIKDHLDLVFNKVTPKRSIPKPIFPSNQLLPEGTLDCSSLEKELNQALNIPYCDSVDRKVCSSVSSLTPVSPQLHGVRIERSC